MIGASERTTDGAGAGLTPPASERRASARSGLATVLVVAHMLEPLHGLAVEHFLDGDVCHRRRRCRAVPVLLARREPHDVAGADLLDRTTLTLREPAAEEHDERLAERVSVPR